MLLYGNNANPNVNTPNGLPFDSRFLCGKWCNYTTLGSAAGSFAAGLIPPLQGFPMSLSSGVARARPCRPIWLILFV